MTVTGSTRVAVLLLLGGIVDTKVVLELHEVVPVDRLASLQRETRRPGPTPASV